jgi:hypothetical protein
VSTLGSGKRTPVEDYPTHHRGGSGVITFKVIPKTGPVATARMVREGQELLVISQHGIVLRTRMDSISVQGRPTQGVAVINLGPGDAVGSVAVIEMSKEQGAAPAEGPQADGPPETTAEAPKGTAKAKTDGKAAKKPNDKKVLSRADAALRKADATLRKTRSTNGRPKNGKPKGKGPGRSGKR